MAFQTTRRSRYFKISIFAVIITSILGGLLYAYLLSPKKVLLRDPTVQRGIVFCEYGENKLLLDYYPADTGAGLVVFLHGGGWSSGSRKLKSKSAQLVKAIRETGLNVASIDYRLLPEHQLEDMLNDIGCALNYLHRRGHELGHDSGLIGILGISAGGHLGLLTAGRNAANERLALQAVAAMFAPTNFNEASQLWSGLPESFFGQLMTDLLGSVEYARLQAASPLYYAEHLNLPSLLVYGDKDKVVHYKQGTAMHHRLQALKQPSEFILVQNSGHLEPASFSSTPDWSELSQQVANFFSKSLH